MAISIWFGIGWDIDFFLDGTKSFPEPIVTNYQRGSVVFDLTCWQFHKKYSPWYEFVTTYLRLQWLFYAPRVNQFGEYLCCITLFIAAWTLSFHCLYGNNGEIIKAKLVLTVCFHLTFLWIIVSEMTCRECQTGMQHGYSDLCKVIFKVEACQ